MSDTKTVRSKFKLTQINETEYGRTLIFETIYDDSIPEDKRFCKATPTGKIEMLLTNEAVFEFFTVGSYYYFDAVPTTARKY